MQLNRFNQITIEETDELLEEQNQCPKCFSKIFSSVFMERIATNANLSWAITNESISKANQSS